MTFSAPCFMNVGGTGVYLSDLKVTGYSEAEGGEDAIEDALTITKINPSGAAKKAKDGIHYEIYHWFDNPDGDYPAGWYDDDAQPMKDGGSYLDDADTIFFGHGEGFRVQQNEGYEDLRLKIVYNGEVKQSQTEFTGFLPGVMTGCGNATPRARALSEFWVSGYSEAEGGEDAIEDALSITKINPSGAAKKAKDGIHYEIYHWFDNPDGDYPAGWYDDDAQPMKDGGSYLDDADKIVFGPGDGFRLQQNEGYEELHFTLHTPSPMGE